MMYRVHVLWQMIRKVYEIMQAIGSYWRVLTKKWQELLYILQSYASKHKKVGKSTEDNCHGGGVVRD